MTTSASLPNPFETARTGMPASSRPSLRTVPDTARSTRSLDEQLAPLRIPALVLGTLLICLGVAALLPMRAWVHDYGGWLVIVAYLQYMAMASALEIWGLRMIRTGHRGK
ncbi:hypothetical protein [Nocardia xishanensis]|uniref:Uncharacterized protein n=1 Tax=Nocardia xishanensis TaxID=238964 RepID=A0ABW7X7P1_9NOCA